jgi:hypothetical protein
MNAGSGGAAALEALAGVFGRDGWVTVLTSHGPGHTPRLHVANRSVPALASDVYAEAGWFWWPHAERIARAGCPGQAAAVIAQTLGAGAPAGGPVGGQAPAAVGAPTQAAAGPLPQRIPPDHASDTHRVPPDGHPGARL